VNHAISPPRELLLLRHGIAEDRSPGILDAQRSLTERGRKRTRAVLERAVDLGLQTRRVISSPLLRARQTAEIAVACTLAADLELSDALAPAADPLPLLDEWLARLDPAAGPAQGRLLLVGHEPDLSRLVARLIGAPEGAIALRKAGLALLRFDETESRDRARLRLLLTPAALLEGAKRG
jgi:phosphohistidine phosphatase